MAADSQELSNDRDGDVPPRRRPRVSSLTGPLVHLQILIASSLVLLAACLLEVRDQEYVALPCVSNEVLPTVCMSRRVLGMTCPGCGLTRSFVYLVHGDWRASLQAHRMGWIFALIVFSQIPYRIYRLIRPGAGLYVPNWFWIGFTVVLVVNWIVGLPLW